MNFMTILSELHQDGIDSGNYEPFIDAALCSRVTKPTSVEEEDLPFRAKVNVACDRPGPYNPGLARDFDSAIGIVENVDLLTAASLSTTVNFHGTIKSPLHINSRAFNAQVRPLHFQVVSVENSRVDRGER